MEIVSLRAIKNGRKFSFYTKTGKHIATIKADSIAEDELEWIPWGSKQLAKVGDSARLWRKRSAHPWVKKSDSIAKSVNNRKRALKTRMRATRDKCWVASSNRMKTNLINKVKRMSLDEWDRFSESVANNHNRKSRHSEADQGDG